MGQIHNNSTPQRGSDPHKTREGSGEPARPFSAEPAYKTRHPEPPGDLRKTVTGVDLQIIRLREMAERLAGFMNTQFRRLEHVQSSLAGLVEQHKEFAGASGELQALQREWEEKRNKEIELLRCEHQELEQAWARLEVEQRELLIKQESIRAAKPAGGPAVPSSAQAAPAPAVQVMARVQRDDAAEQRQADRAQPVIDLEQARVQFMKLKREVRQHAERFCAQVARS